MPRVKAFDEAAILDKAMELFWHQGYNATSYNDLVANLGINRQSIYDTYGDKQQLYLSALNRFRQKSLADLKTGMCENDNPRQTIEKLLEVAVITSLSDNHQKGCFLVNSTIELAPHEKIVARIAQQNMEDIVNLVQPIVERGQALGQITNKHTANSIALFMFNMLNGIKVFAKMDLPKQVYDDVLRVAYSVMD